MYSNDELIRTPEYWMETIQNELFRQVASYMEREGLNQTQLAGRMGVSKGYVSQILNGNFRFSLAKLIEISLLIGQAPLLQFTPLDRHIEETEQARLSKRKLHTMAFTPTLSVQVTANVGSSALHHVQPSQVSTIEYYVNMHNPCKIEDTQPALAA